MKNCENYRAGNFLFVLEKRSGMNYITCSTLTKEWHVRFREDIIMFTVISTLIDAEDFDKLSSLATLWYAHSVMLHSADYYAAVGKALVDDVEKAEKVSVSKDDDDEMLEEVADMEKKQEAFDFANGDSSVVTPKETDNG